MNIKYNKQHFYEYKNANYEHFYQAKRELTRQIH